MGSSPSILHSSGYGGIRPWPPDSWALLKKGEISRAGGAPQCYTPWGGHVLCFWPLKQGEQSPQRIYLMTPGTSVPQGTGPDTGNTKRPLEFWTLSFRNVDTWKKIYMSFFCYVFMDTYVLRMNTEQWFVKLPSELVIWREGHTKMDMQILEWLYPHNDFTHTHVHIHLCVVMCMCA